MAVDGSTLGERQEPVRIRRDIGREGTRRATKHRIRAPVRSWATAVASAVTAAMMTGDE
jgi:hypothetical protein